VSTSQKTNRTSPGTAEQSLLLAEAALDRIRALRLSAKPVGYEIWYVYAAGSNPALNREINAIIEASGSIQQEDLETIGSSHLPSLRCSDQFFQIGGNLNGQFHEIVQLLDDAIEVTSTYSDSLARATGVFSEAADNPSIVKKAVRDLAEASLDMRRAGDGIKRRIDRSKQEIQRMRREIEVAWAESQTDSLTGIANRKFFDAKLAQAIAHSNHTGEPLSLLVLDVDHFKSFNDKHGHSTGDQVLKLVAHSIRQTIKGRDLVARIGGEEFAVLLPATNIDQATSVANKLRCAVGASELKKRSTGERIGRVTVSGGIAALHPSDTSLSLLDRADSCLYEAKRAGRNRVVAEQSARAEPIGPAPAHAMIGGR
jgi:diguanylate cyclase